MIAAWTRPGPFRWEGKHFHYRVVNPWVLPWQKPHPPIMVPGTASPETQVVVGTPDQVITRLRYVRDTLGRTYVSVGTQRLHEPRRHRSVHRALWPGGLAGAARWHLA